MNRNSNRLMDSAAGSRASQPSARDNTSALPIRARAHEAEIITVLSADYATPILFSKARLFRKPSYAVLAEIRFKRALGGDYVLFTIARLVGGVYDLDSPVYQTSDYADMLDVWSIFEAG